MTSIAVSTPATSSAPRLYRPRYKRKYTARRRARYTPRRRLVKRRRRAVPARRGLSMSKFVYSQIDPFDVNTNGVKIPDSNTYPSTALRVDDEWTMTTDAVNGLALSVFNPHIVATRVTGTAASASTWTFTAAYGGSNNSGRQSSIGSNFTSYRPVAHAIRLSCPVAATTAKGFVHVAIFAQSTFGHSTWTYPTSLTGLNNCMFYQRYPLSTLTQRYVTVVNKFLDCTSTRYLDTSSDGIEQSTDAMFQGSGWASIVVCVESANLSENSLVVESVSHIEATPYFNGINTATPAAPFNVRDLQNVSHLAGETPAATLQGEEGRTMSQAVNAMAAEARSRFVDTATGRIREYATDYAGALGAAAGNAAGAAIGAGIFGVTTQRLASGFSGGNFQPRLTR